MVVKKSVRKRVKRENTVLENNQKGEIKRDVEIYVNKQKPQRINFVTKADIFESINERIDRTIKEWHMRISKHR